MVVSPKMLQKRTKATRIINVKYTAEKADQWRSEVRFNSEVRRITHKRYKEGQHDYKAINVKINEN